MNPMTALLFPDTAPSGDIVRQLLFFFEKLILYLPAEPDPAGQPDPAAGLPGSLCRAYPPAPLGNELDRFHGLIRELEQHKQGRAGQLGTLALAVLSTALAGDRDEASSTRLRAALTRSPDKVVSARQGELWQARVLLRLAETLDREEQEIAAGLTAVAGSERDLLDALRGRAGEDDREWREPALVTPGAVVRQRVKAFARLYLADTDPEQPQVLATGRFEAADPLLAAYEKLRNDPPVLRFTLPLPDPGDISATGGDIAAYIDLRAAFRIQAGPAIGTLTGTPGDPDGPEPDQAIAAWEKALADTVSPGPWPWEMQLYAFPGVSVETLFRHAFPATAGTDVSTITRVPIPAAGPAGLLALLRRR
ncbi:MAG: hypothetical protein L3J03_06165 [Desulfobacterales bacterium]|nr:hypothetical protein [Desulfobacterales bacterium]